MENRKMIYARSTQAAANSLASIYNLLEDLQKTYDHRQYGPGGVNAFSDEELMALEAAGGVKMTADQIYAFIILCAQFKIFMEEGVPAVQDYRSILNRMRTDM